MYSLTVMLSCAGICGVLKFHHPTPAIEIRGHITSKTPNVARASRPLSRERPAPASGRGQDALATAGETPTLHFNILPENILSNSGPSVQQGFTVG
jgi:hypothetical protein